MAIPCEVLFDLKTKYDAVLVAVGRDDGEYELNPPADSKMRPGDLLLVISAREVGSLGDFGPAVR